MANSNASVQPIAIPDSQTWAQQPSSGFPHLGNPDNPANHEDQHVEGYPKLAFFFSQSPRYLHLRRFSALSIRLLLYRQHELILLEKRLLALETEDAHKFDTVEGRFRKDFFHLKSRKAEEDGALTEQNAIYQELKKELRDYEEALIRFDRLCAKGFDVTELRTVQRFLSHPKGCNDSLSGIDAHVWGSLSNPSDFASDIIQVVHQTEPSVIGKLIKNVLLRLTPRLPHWAWLMLFWSRKRLDVYQQHSYSARTCENLSMAFGNIATSLLVYAAVASLYFADGKVFNVVTVLIIAVTVTACSMMFQNQQFVSMLGTVCAVLVTLLANDRAKI